MGFSCTYQYRILLVYSVATKPEFPSPSQMTAEVWNRFVDGFDVRGFAEQMAEGRVGWVLFLDDHYFAWPCAPNKAFSDFTGYAPGEECSRRDLILDLAGALNAKGVKLICYFAGLNGYMKEPKVSAGFMEGDGRRGGLNEKTPPVQNEQIFPFDDNLVSRPGPRLVDGLEGLARLFHRELFD